MKKQIGKCLAVLTVVLICAFSPLNFVLNCNTGLTFISAAASDIRLEKINVVMTTGTAYTQKLLSKNGKAIKASKIKWKSADKKTAKIDKNGKITALKKGAVKMTATYKNKKYTFKVTVKNATLSVSKKTLAEGESFNLTLKNAEGKKINPKHIEWSTSDKSIASVSSKGKVRAKKEGSVKIYAKYKGKKYSCSLKVKAIDVTLSLSSTEIILYGNATEALTATASPTDATVKWASADTEVAGVSADGVVTAKKEGITYVTATLFYNGKDRKTEKCKITVKAFSLDVKEKNIDLYIGQACSPGYKLSPKEASVEWKSSNPDIASVDRDGLIEAKKEGTAEITLTAAVDGQAKSVVYDVKVSAPYISLDKNNIEAYINEDFTVNVTAEPSDVRIYTELLQPSEIVQSSKTTEKDGRALAETYTFYSNKSLSGSVRFYFYYLGDVYSQECRINIKSKPLIYNYSCVLLGDMYSGSYYPVNSLYGTGAAVLYVKTDNPDPESFDVTDTDTNYSIVQSLTYDDGHRISENNNSVFFDVVRRDGAESSLWIPVEGGYIGITKYTGVSSGKKRFCVVEKKDGVRYGADFEVTVLDYDEELNKWCDRIIDEATTDEMNVHEKMKKICQYLSGKVKYLPNKNGKIRLLADAVGPSFKTMYMDSYISPAILVRIGERMGYELENMYFSGDWSLHHYVKGVYEGEEHLYSICPPSYSGEIGMLDFGMIDFSKY